MARLCRGRHQPGRDEGSTFDISPNKVLKYIINSFIHFLFSSSQMEELYFLLTDDYNLLLIMNYEHELQLIKGVQLKKYITSFKHNQTSELHNLFVNCFNIVVRLV